MDNEPENVYYELALCSTGQVVAVPVTYPVEVVSGILQRSISVAQREVNKAKGVEVMSEFKGLELAIELIAWLEDNNKDSEHRCLMDDLADLVLVIAIEGDK